MSTELGIVSPGGGAFITIWPPDADPVVIDAYAEMPGRGRSITKPVSTDRVHMGYGGGMETVVGWGSVATPGAFAGFEMASQLHGVVPWSELFGPTIAVLKSGFTVSEASGYYLSYAHDVIYGWDSETAPIFHRGDGSPVRAGDEVVNLDLANCLEVIATQGADLMYRGELGALLVRASKDRGGLITRVDLEEYAPVVRAPSRVALRGWDIATNAPPAVGGEVLAALLTLVDRHDVDGWTAADVAQYAEIQDAVFSFRRVILDGETDRVAGSILLARLAASGDLKAIHQSPSTVQVSVVDDTGLACSITASAGYGSGAVIPGTGFGLNNSLGELELTSEGLHALAPGTRLLSNMAPTVARSPSGGVMALGSPGADRITSAIASVLMNHIVCEMDIASAVGQPRIHAEVIDGTPTLAVEPGVDTSQVEDLVIRTLPEHSMYFGGVQVAMYDGESDLVGAEDPRRAGAIRIGGTRSPGR